MLRKLQKTSTASDVIVIVETFDTLKSRFIRDKAVWRTKLWFSYRSIKVVLHGTIRMIWFVWLLFGCKRFDLKSLLIVYITEKWYIEWQRVTTNDNEWPLRLTFLFFQIREEPTTKHPKDNSLNLEEDLWRRPIELRAETSTQEEILTVRSRNCRSSCSQIFIKISVLKNFAIFTGRDLCWSPFSRKLQDLKHASLKRRLQRKCFPVNIEKFLRTAFSIEQLWWLLLELRHNFKNYEDSMIQT